MAATRTAALLFSRQLIHQLLRHVHCTPYGATVRWNLDDIQAVEGLLLAAKHDLESGRG